LSSICNNIPQSINPPVSESHLAINWKGDYNRDIVSNSKSYPTPYQLTKTVIQTRNQQTNKDPNSNVRKQKNYRVHCIDNKVTQPQLIDIKNIVRLNSTKKTNVFCNIKKVESKITIKLKKSDSDKKKIVIKNSRYVYPDTHIRYLKRPCNTFEIQI